VAEDHELMRETVVHLLNREFDVLEAVGDGHALLKAAALKKPDVCVIDISMPVMSGIETALRLKQSGSLAKIIFLTIYDDSDFVSAALKIGADAYVVKTKMASNLRFAIREALASRTFVSSSRSLSARNMRNNGRCKCAGQC
jgi:DNA-binding NarL/FixJ family response regulator